MRQAEFSAAKHLLSFFSSPCFSVKFVYNYGLRSLQSRNIALFTLTLTLKPIEAIRHTSYTSYVIKEFHLKKRLAKGLEEIEQLVNHLSAFFLVINI
jgi:hypothetical protein